jgi:hypothetical protein
MSIGVRAILTVVVPLESGLGIKTLTTAETATFVFYGNQHEASVPFTRAVFLPSRSLCRDGIRKLIKSVDVGDAVVYTDWTPSAVSWCDRAKIYETLVVAGATAFVQLSANKIPGIMSYHHQSWKSVETRTLRPLTVVEVSADDVDLDAWRTAPSLSMRIQGPHNNRWRDMYTSSTWSITLQILFPLFALWLSLYSACEGISIIRLKRGVTDQRQSELYNFAFVVCVSESILCLILGIILALGQW